MKKYIYLLGAVGTTIFGTSCKKDFTCKCTQTDSLSTDADVYEYTIKEARKTHAKSACVSTEREYTSQTYVGGTWVPVVVTSETDCNLD